MSTAVFQDDVSRLLLPEVFEFLLDLELKRSVRSQAFLTLLSIEVRREWDGVTVTADDGTVADVARIISREVRETDPVARLDRGLLGLMLLDADTQGGSAVIGRVMARVDGYRFSSPLAISIGAACCPTHAVDGSSLKREAVSRPMVISARRSLQPQPTTDPK
jgi:GGDEF domain-containing protein